MVEAKCSWIHRYGLLFMIYFKKAIIPLSSNVRYAESLKDVCLEGHKEFPLVYNYSTADFDLKKDHPHYFQVQQQIDLNCSKRRQDELHRWESVS